MRSFDEVCRERNRNLVTALAVSAKDLADSKTAMAAKESESASLRDEITRLHGERQGFDGFHQKAAAEIRFLKQQISDLERQVHERLKAIDTYQGKVASVDKEIKSRQTQVRAILDESDRLTESLSGKETELQKAGMRELEGRLKALDELLSENLGVLQQFLAQETQRERWRRLRKAYEEARTTDRAVMDAHEKTVDIPRLIESTDAESVRKILRDELERARKLIEERFPGFHSAPSGDEPSELAETFYWFDSRDNLTLLLLPLPGRFWNAPPENQDDPRGEIMCKILASFAAATSGLEPKCEQFGDFIVVEFDGNRSQDLQNKAAIPVRFSSGKSIDFMLQELPTSLREAFTHENSAS